MSFPCRTHCVCLVSAQTLPNYLGCIEFDPLPKTVHLIVTGRMKECADILENALKVRGCRVEQYPLADPSPNAMMEVLDRIREKTGTDVAINVTGGTKIMALAAVEWAGIQDEHPFLFYMDTASRKIWQISGRVEQYEMTKFLGLKELFRACAGMEISIQSSGGNSSSEREVLEELIRVFLKSRNALELFNKCASEAFAGLYTDMPCGNLPEFRQAVAIARKAGKLQETSDRIIYSSEDARRWCNGGWIEEFVKTGLFKLRHSGIINDWGSNITVLEKQKEAKKSSRSGFNVQDAYNELDAAFTAFNNFFVIECKTANLAKNKEGFSTAIYKLNSLRQSFGGTFSSGMIVSVHEPRSEDLRRAKEYQIELVYGNDLLKFEEKLQKWVQNVNR